MSIMSMYLKAAPPLLQDSLKRRMEELKKNILEASAAVEEERRRNVELLRMVFPSGVAQKLWRSTSCNLGQGFRVLVVRTLTCSYFYLKYHD